MSQMHGPDVRVKVAMDGDKPVRELWVRGENLGPVSFLWILYTGLAFLETLQFR